MKIDVVFTKKQQKVIKDLKKFNPRITILSGAKRSGKTFINNLYYLYHVSEFQGKRKNFILAGATQGSIWRNVLLDYEKILDRKISIHKDGSFDLFGNRVFIFGGDKSDSWKTLRGMTSHGTYFNEMTALHKTFIEEAFSRTSGEGARIIADTNPDNPNHFIKKNYINKAFGKLENGDMDIYHESFKLDDNDRLDPIYVQSIKNSTPSGSTYDRDINGLWVASEGIIYKDFDNNNIVDEVPEIKKHILGVDWGYEHFGTIVVIGVGYDENYYLVDYVAERQKYFGDYWKLEIQKKAKEYNVENIYCDTARAEYVSELMDLDLPIGHTDKSVKEGIDYVGSLIKQNKFLIKRDIFNNRLEGEIYSYVWGNGDEPKKEYDDILDAIRYALFSEKTNALEPVTFSEAWWR